MAKRNNVAVRVLVWLAFAAVLGAPFAYLTLREPVVDVTVTKVERGHVEQTITSIAAGSVMSHLDAMVAAEVMGTVMAMPFDEGAQVQANDVLVELKHTELDAQVALAEANLRAGQSRLEQARLAAQIYEEVSATQVSQTEAQLDVARLRFNRVKSLSEQKAVSQSDLDEASLGLRVATESHSAALASQRENKVRQEEIRTAEASIEQLDAGVQVAKAAREKAFIRAPFAGIVAKTLVDVGEAVTMGMPLVQLVNEKDCYVEAPFDEANAAEVKLGQKARINIDAYRAVDFPGEVVFISPTVTPKLDLSRTLDVRIRILEGAEKLMPGTSADVMILADEKDGVLFVPTESLIREEAAFVIENGRAVLRDVKPGVGNWRTREVVEGLSEGETIITSVSLKDLRDGVRVHVVDKLADR